MNRYRLVHTTEFHYDGPVSESYNEVRLRPIHDEKQSCLSFRLVSSPSSRVTAFRDSFGNWVHQFNILSEHRQLRVEAESVVLTHEDLAPAPLSLSLSDLDDRRDEIHEDFYDHIASSAYVPHLPALLDFVEASGRRSGATAVGFARAAADLIHAEFRYVKGATHVHSSISDSLSLRAGVCQDFAHLLLGIVRMRGLPGRYVSGYLVPGAASASGSTQEEVIGGQASHAWAEVWIPDCGWCAFDPTLGSPVGLRHIRVACGRDYGDVAPLRGVYKGHAGQRLSVDVRVRPALDEDGHEQMNKPAANLPESPALVERPQQPGQQQQ